MCVSHAGLRDAAFRVAAELRHARAQHPGSGSEALDQYRNQRRGSARAEARVLRRCGYYRRTFQNLLQTDFVDRSQADYTPVKVTSPLNGEVITAYNLAPAKLNLTQTFDTNATSDRKQTFNGYELAMNARVRGGITVFGGLSFQKTVNVTCDQPDDPNLLRFCDQGDSGIPFGTDAKLNISYPVPLWGLQVSGVFQSYQGQAARTDWLISRTTNYAADCIAPCTPGARRDSGPDRGVAHDSVDAARRPSSWTASIRSICALESGLRSAQRA